MRLFIDLLTTLLVSSAPVLLLSRVFQDNAMRSDPLHKVMHVIHFQIPSGR